MAISKNNVITRGLSGKIGDQLIFRQYGDKTVVSKMPQMPAEATEAQKASRDRFRQAMAYARQAMADPDLKAAYEAAAAKGRNAYNVAVADFMHAPEIKSIDLTGYAGNPGDTIRIHATDDFLVKEVKLVIYRDDGLQIESGDAIPDSLGVVWTYTVMQANPNFQGGKITVTASDFPGNKDVEERTL